MLTWNQVGIIAKPVGLLNIAGFWDGLITYIQRAAGEGMIKKVFVDLLVIEQDPERLLERMAAFQPNPDAAKFFTKA